MMWLSMSLEQSAHNNKVLTVSEKSSSSSKEVRLTCCHRLEVTVRGENNEVKKIAFLQSWEL